VLEKTSDYFNDRILNDYEKISENKKIIAMEEFLENNHYS